ncbi:ATP-binding cassette domain-containing protein [Amnibacterium flavum]|uniref:ABC transporter ATP-binding protein n=1 Tax=Amnibacterium flavum TaxID=2173173 RepID=A0A2V1HNA3_9MICO|nr:ABC transporter ATP-binding protein [Amnibacterium flavum]PVZ94076.1 ABC transporter ATP-binding protein [Amnibacterium flavum]
MPDPSTDRIATAPSRGIDEPVCRVEDLTVDFETADGLVRALRGVSLEIGRGEILALVGESGSGKTVLSSCLLGLPPASLKTTVGGSVVVAGVDMVNGSDADRRVARRQTIGAVFQDPLTSLDPMMRIGDQVAERGATRARATAALEDCGVPEPGMRLRQWPHQLSGGLRQRVSIAAAITAGSSTPRRGPGVDTAQASAGDGVPALLIADEPTTALDVRVQAQIIALFARLRDEHGCSIVLVTHDLGVAAQIADRIAVMSAGELCEVGSTEQILRDPQHEYTKSLLAARIDINRMPVSITERSRVVAERRDDDALRLEGISKHYPKAGGRRGEIFTAVDDVSLTVPAGGSVALVGESGCGKSTLLRIAAGLTKADSGGVHVAPGSGRPQLVFQDAGSSLTPWFSIGQGIEERLRVQGVSRREAPDRARELLAQVGLDARAAGARPRALSGGQRQRAAIARALASDPRILLCDEPVSALDASHASRVLDLLDELRASLGIALLMVTHDLAVARRISDETAVMYGGRIIERSASEQLFAEPREDYTRQLIAASPSVY